ncbi:DExH-box ATP-dependent RNA helicase DExH12 [Sarracenia purpurea var. burkii]
MLTGVLDEKLRKSKTRKEREPVVSEPMLTGRARKGPCKKKMSRLQLTKVFTSRRPRKQEQLMRLFSESSNSSWLITDFHDAGDAGGSAAADGDDALDDDVGVAVEFEVNEEEEEESDLDMVPKDEEEEDDVIEGDGGWAMQIEGRIDDNDMHEANEGMALNVQDIDTYWLQRKISHAYEQQIDP